MGWQDGLEVFTLTYKLSSLGWNPEPAINCHSRDSRQGDLTMCVPSLGLKLYWASHLPAFVGGH